MFSAAVGGFMYGVPNSGPVPTENTAGWFGGGNQGGAASPTVYRVTYATDTATASTRGPLSSAASYMAATGNFTYGWFGGGYGDSAPGWRSTVQRITYATDTATASVKGPLNSGPYTGIAATSTDTYGWFGGGYNSSVSPVIYYTTVQRITFATDTATAGIRGPLATASGYLAAVGTSNNGWYGGGRIAGPSMSTVQRITYATDTATASIRGPLDFQKYQWAAVSDNTTYGWFGGGLGGYTNLQRITYATDTATASIRGTMAVNSAYLAAATDYTYGWFGGGYVAPAPGFRSTIQRITYATDTMAASIQGPLGATRRALAATSGIQ